MAVGAVFGAVNTMYAALSSRTPEIALLLTLGFYPRSVLATIGDSGVAMNRARVNVHVNSPSRGGPTFGARCAPAVAVPRAIGG